MTGTSIDGELDAALVEVRGTGLGLEARPVAVISWPLGALADDLRRVAAQEPMPASELARIARAFGETHADAVAELCGDAGVAPDLVALHGQTVFHAPPLSWQLIDPWPVAARLGCRVRYDLRGANLASGGQGAPITPLADFVLFADDAGAQTILNLGGFINATLLPRRARGVDAIRGFDVCACNHLLDRVARARLGARFDGDGAAAARGRADEALVGRIADAIAPRERDGGNRSLGTGDEATRLVDLTAALAADDACRTICEAIAAAVARVLAGREGAERLVVAGGSARNRALVEALGRRTGATVATTESAYGIPVGMREAVEMAVLGALADDGVGYCLPAVTGAASSAVDSALIEPLARRNPAV